MAAYYYTFDVYQGAYSTTNTTTNLGDGAVGDTTTYVATFTVVGGNTVQMTLFYDNVTPFTVTDIAVTGFNNYFDGTTYILEGSSNSTAWTSVSTGTFAYAGGGPWSGVVSVVGGGPYRYWRLSLKRTYAGGSSEFRASDWRFNTVSGTSYTSSVDDPLTVTDTVGAVAAFARTPDDPLTVTDTVGAVADFARTSDDPLTVTDTVGAVADFARTSDDPVSVADSVLAASDFSRPIDDVVDITDTVTASLGQPDDGLLKRLRFYLSKDGSTNAGASRVVTQPVQGLGWAKGGGPVDMWGTSWTPAELNASGFTVFVEVPRDLASESAVYRLLDSLRVTINYVPPGGPRMAIRETARQTTLLGKESTLGDGATPTIRLRHARVQLQPKPTFKNYSTPGEKTDSHQLLIQELTEGPLEGIPTYDELGYLLASLISKPATSVLQSGVAYRHVFFLDNRLKDSIQTYCAQYGDPVVRAHQANALIVTALELALRQDAAEMSGTIMAQILTDAVTLASGAATVQGLTQSGSGVFRLRFRGQETADITASGALTASTLQTALRALPYVNASTELTVTGSAGGPFVITFGNAAAGPFYGIKQPLLEARIISGTPVATLAMTTPGGHTVVPGVAILPRHLEVWLNPTYANIGQTAGKLTDAYVSSFGMSNRAAPVFNLDRTNTSWYAYVEPENMDIMSNVIVNANSNGMSFLPQGRSDTILYQRILATGPLIGVSALPHRLQIDMPVKIAGYGPFSDNQGTYAHEYQLKATFDESLNQTLVVTLDNGVASY